MCIVLYLVIRARVLTVIGQMMAQQLSILFQVHVLVTLFEPHQEKNGFLPMRKQRRRSASQ